MEFYVPPTLPSDFEDMLNTPGFGTQVTVNPGAAGEYQTVVQLSNPNFKSNYQNLSDSARILRFKLSDNIKKGDYISTSEGVTYIVTWQPFLDINSYKSQCQRCNTNITIEEYRDAVLDSDTGQVISIAGYYDVVSGVKAFTTRNTMGIFSAAPNDIGIVPLGRMMLGMQFNEGTSKIKIGHEFRFRDSQYKVVDIDYSQTEDDADTGCLVLYSEKLEGGRRATV